MSREFIVTLCSLHNIKNKMASIGRQLLVKMLKKRKKRNKSRKHKRAKQWTCAPAISTMYLLHSLWSCYLLKLWQNLLRLIEAYWMVCKTRKFSRGRHQCQNYESHENLWPDRIFSTFKLEGLQTNPEKYVQISFMLMWNVELEQLHLWLHKCAYSNLEDRLKLLTILYSWLVEV